MIKQLEPDADADAEDTDNDTDADVYDDESLKNQIRVLTLQLNAANTQLNAANTQLNAANTQLNAANTKLALMQHNRRAVVDAVVEVLDATAPPGLSKLVGELCNGAF